TSAPSAGAAASSTRAATAITSRKMERFERKAGATIRGTRRGPQSGPGEGSVSLFDERGHAFAHVISAEKLMLDVCLQLELCVQVPVEHLVERALAAGVRLRRAGCQLLGQVERALRQRLRLDHAVDKT